MTARILGLNIGYSYVDDYGALTKFHNDLHPAYSVMVIDGKPEHLPENISKAKTLTASMPGTNWIYRVFNKDDGGFWLPGANREAQIATPENYMGSYGHLGQGGGILSLLNEPSGDLSAAQLDGMVKWVVKCMWIAIERGIRCCVVNWADRNPRIENGLWHERYKEILSVGALRPDLFLMGLHLYGPDSLTDHLEAYVQSCKVWDVPVMPVVATEFGIDSIGDKAQGYRQHGYDGAGYARWKESVVTGELAPYIQRGELVGLCTFAWNWTWAGRGFDVQRDPDWQRDILAAANRGVFDMVVKPVVIVPKPESAIIGTKARVKFTNSTKNRNLRSEPRYDADYVGDVVKDALVCWYAIPHTTGVINPKGETGRWVFVEVLSETTPRSVVRQGWMWDGYVQWDSSRVTTEVPIVKPDAPSGPQPPVAPPPPAKEPEIVLTVTRAELKAMMREVFRELLLEMATLAG